MEASLIRRFAALVVSAGFLAAQARDRAPTIEPAAAASAGPGAPGSHAGVSADVLRHPISGKAQRMLLVAIDEMDAGNHTAAIEQLQKTLAKFPDSAAYVYNLLGVEYVKINRFADAVHFLEQAVTLLADDSMTHYNLGLALVCAGDDSRAIREFQRAADLDPTNVEAEAKIKRLLEQQAHSHR